jgi:cell surface protein SprA
LTLTLANIQKRHNCFNTNKLIIVFTIIINLFAICNVTFSQGRRDLDKFRTYVYNPFDTLKIKLKDSSQIALEDSLRRIPVDSTARVKYFKFIRKYVYGTPLVEKTHPLILDNSSLIKTELSFDSVNNVVIHQKFNDEDIKAPLVIPIDKYLGILSVINEKNIFNNIFSEQFKGITADDISQLFQKFTDITIPLPFKSETIFGPPTANLRINGAIDITASYQNIQSEQSVLTLNSNSQNNINFKQEVQVTAKGTIGDKLTVEADWNTQRVFDFENQLKIKYTGYADEVIQKIEAGNVSLDTKSSLIQSTQALFGIKGEFKLGPLYLSAVISQKKSKQETKDYTGGAQQQDFQINVYDYSDSHYFIDTLYKTSFIAVYNDSTGMLPDSVINVNRIKSDMPSFQVWVQCDNTVALKKNAVAWILLRDKQTEGGYLDSVKFKRTDQVTDSCFYGYFRELNPTEYAVDPYAGFISLKISVPDNYAVGVTYETYGGKKYGNGKYDVIGNEMMILKMIKCANQSPDATPRAWELKMKNVYRLPISKVIQDGFKLDVMYNNNNVLQTNLPDQRISLSTMLYEDRYSGTTKKYAPDGLFDYIPGKTINVETGDIIFPTLRPFLDNILQVPAIDTSYKYEEIYTKRKTDAMTSIKATKYYIKGNAKGEAGISNTINLGFNVVQGSVKLTLGSLVLRENEDYSVDYNTGIVVIRNATALASKDLKISYETNDLFSLASKTLFGIRGDYKISDKTGFGFTFVNLKQETLNDKVRIGEEPTNNSMVGIDFTTEAKPKFLTKLVNLLPGYNTKEESSVSFKSELAYILPDPNTKKSPIPQDNNEAIAYVDDMEGAKKIVSLGINYSYWTMSSLPVDTIDTGEKKENNLKRGRLRWYNVANGVNIKDVYPLRDVQPGQDRITPLVVNFDPKSRGTYNPNVGNWDTTTKSTNWNGFMRYLNTTSTDLINENINFIEFNMQISNITNTNLSNAKMMIDLGYISEDAIPDGKINTEDSLNNGILKTEFDLGLDFLTDQQELAYINQFNNANYSIDTFPNRDPMLDNNDSTGNINYNIINGTQNNRLFEGGNKPDTEDLNHDGSLLTFNQYFEYVIKLDTTNNKRISGRGAPGTGWFQYRVPLSEFSRKIGTANLNHIEYARVWITGLDSAITMQLVDFNLVGNQWYKPNKGDNTYDISVVSIEENSQIYMSPVPGDVLRQTVRNTSGVNTKSNEQSLSMQVKNLTNGQGKIAVKDYLSQTLDLFNYRMLKLFVNGDPSFNYTNENVYDATMIVRFGTDSLNFYEYRAPIHPDIRPGQPWNSQNEVSINFADLTSLKFRRDSVSQVIDMNVPNGPPGAIYRIKGAPALNIIRQFVVGVEKNRAGPNSTISGSVWFNEIRVLKVNDDNGYAYNINTSVKFADLANVTFNVSKVDPNFHSIDTRVGSRNTGQSWDFSASINVHKIINNAIASAVSDDWKDFLNLPVSIRHSENLTNPKYYPGTDIEIEKAAEEKYRQVLAKTNDETLAALARDNLKKEAQTLVVRNDIAVTGMAFKFPGNNYFVKKIVNAFSINFNASFGSQRDVTYERKTDFNYSGSLNFSTDFGLTEKYNLKLGKLLNLGEQYKSAKVYLFLPFLPLAPMFTSNFTATTDFNRSRNESKQRQYSFDDPTGRLFKANRGFGFNWKFIEDWILDITGTYNVRIGSELTQLETYNDSLNSQRPNSEIFGDIFFNNSLVNFGKDLDYTQGATINPKFNIPYLNKYMDLATNYSVTYGWINPNTTTNIGYNVGYANTWNIQTNLKLGELLTILKKVDNGQPQKFKSLSSASKSNISDDKTSIADLLKILGTFIPENVNLTFNQTNQVSNPGVEGRPGFGNFWMVASPKDNFGPSRMYQLGLSMYPGKRIPNLSNITDAFNQTNNVTIAASISPIFPQALRMNLTFKRLWGFNNSTSFNSNSEGILGDPINKSINKNFGYSMFFAGSVEKFKFEGSTDANENNKNLSAAFKSQIGSIPFPNWTLTISGLEKFPLFSEFTSTVSIENNFTSEYSEASSVDASNTEVVSRQSVTQSFNPLMGLNISFKPMFGGALTASFRINKSITNSLTPSSSLIQTTNTNDWSLTANYAKAGFEIPLFGLALKNDIAFALTISKNTNEPLDYKFNPGNSTPDQLPGNGSAVTTINPSVQYSLSSKVQMQLFYKYIKTEPTQGILNTIPRTSNEGGLNIRISIQ